VIIDEQHKFGVSQREELVRKGRFPHLLVMTATPIPRTLGLTLYGDLDVSLLDQLPEGRQVIRTHVRDEEALPKVWAFVKKELEAGRQAYVVCPRVAESENDDVRAVKRELGRVREALAPAVVEMVHGQMDAESRDSAMTAFREGRVAVLVATQVIEVGVDVPNASVIVILSAELFGLAQLHQLRGRVGRGSAASHCILVAREEKEASSERLRVIAETRDGFALAEADLKLRGPGEFLGQDQSGMPALRFGDLLNDGDLVRLARDLAREHLRGGGK
jgi:ATP-dependent DNA helicase RecG